LPIGAAFTLWDCWLAFTGPCPLCGGRRPELSLFSRSVGPQEIRDASLGAFFTDRAERRRLLLIALKDIGRVFIVAVVLDTIYELIVFKWFYPVQVVIVAVVCAVVPYVLVRGPITRLARLSVLWQWSTAAPGVVVPTHAYCFDERLRPVEPMRQDQYPWSVQEVLAGRMYFIASLEDSPVDAAVDRETCLRFGIKAGRAIPLVVGGEPPIGALGLNALRAERHWPDTLIKRLQLVAQITNALNRKRTDLALVESEELARATFEQAAVGIAHASTDDRFLRVNDRLCDIAGYPREELLQATRQDFRHPDDMQADLGSALRPGCPARRWRRSSITAGRATCRSRTWTSRPRSLPMSAASRPIGPAPVTSTVSGSQNAR
jgi:PAS domain-containing protein